MSRGSARDTLDFISVAYACTHQHYASTIYSKAISIPQVAVTAQSKPTILECEESHIKHYNTSNELNKKQITRQTPIYQRTI
jgi:hypothetical protein